MHDAVEIRQARGSAMRVPLRQVTDVCPGLCSPEFAKFTQRYNHIIVSGELAKRALVLKTGDRAYSFLFDSEVERDNVGQFIAALVRLHEGNTTAVSTSSDFGNVAEEPPKAGFARVVYQNYTIYEGHFQEFLRHGHGTLTLLDGTKHEGEWRKDDRHGSGTEYWVDGTVIKSTYVDGVRSGLVEMTWPDGSRYKGQFERGRANGEGELTRVDGTVYRGQFTEDSICGEGRMEWQGGVVYTGQFVQNKREGYGKMEWPTGWWKNYTGEWKDSKHHGYGTLLDRNGASFSGIFRNGRLEQWDNDQAAPDMQQVDDMGGRGTATPRLALCEAVR